MNDIELRKWAVEISVKTGSGDVTGDAQRILDFVAPRVVSAPAKKTRGKIDYIRGAIATDAQKKLARKLYVTKTPIWEIQKQVNSLPGDDLGKQNIRYICAGLQRPAEMISPKIKAMLAARRAKGASGHA